MPQDPSFTTNNSSLGLSPSAPRSGPFGPYRPHPLMVPMGHTVNLFQQIATYDVFPHAWGLSHSPGHRNRRGSGEGAQPSAQQPGSEPKLSPNPGTPFHRKFSKDSHFLFSRPFLHSSPVVTKKGPEHEIWGIQTYDGATFGPQATAIFL